MKPVNKLKPIRFTKMQAGKETWVVGKDIFTFTDSEEDDDGNGNIFPAAGNGRVHGKMKDDDGYDADDEDDEVHPPKPVQEEAGEKDDLEVGDDCETLAKRPIIFASAECPEPEKKFRGCDPVYLKLLEKLATGR